MNARKPIDRKQAWCKLAVLIADGPHAPREIIFFEPTTQSPDGNSFFDVVVNTAAALEMSYGTVPPGSLLRTEVARPDGTREHVWQLLTARRDCTDPDCTAVETGQPDCRVVTVEGRGEQHVARWWPVSARVPATTEVEL